MAVTIEHLHKQNPTDKVVGNLLLFGAGCQATGCTTVTSELLSFHLWDSNKN